MNKVIVSTSNQHAKRTRSVNTATEHQTQLAEVKRAAAAAGIPWDALCGRFNELWTDLLTSREHGNNIRRTAWQIHNWHLPKKWPFWRHGFYSQYGRRYSENDCTVVPGYDTLAATIASEFPEWTDRCEELWAFLFSDYTPLPPRIDFYRLALADLSSMVTTSYRSFGDDDFEF